MRWILFTLTLALLACGSCTDDKKQDYNPEKSTMKRPEPWANQKPAAPKAVAAAPAPAGKPIVSDYAPPVPPKDAQFTIYCQDFTGAAHVDVSNRAKANLINSSGLKGWYLIHQEDHSSLFYGYYKTANEASVVRDRQAVSLLHDRDGNAAFASVMIVPVDAPDPTAPAEWNLATLRKGPNDSQHVWTIQVAAYKDSPERKQAAVGAVKAARAQGIEAYYFHGDNVSSVCVGCWSKEAVRIEGAAMEKDGEHYFGAPEGQEVIIAPGMNIADGAKRALEQKGISPASPRVTIVNSAMLSMKKQYPEHSVNGVIATKLDRKGNRIEVPSPSLIMEIPVASPSMGLARSLPGMETPAPPPQEVRAVMPTNSQPTPGAGKLKSVGR